ncbi:MAG TPA: PQQ-binding-like beta-propeller repeat protein [Desulfomonilaceae bacterium]|nr:PQQ-binding-like beta-propeller repeat protein [Desulfomonilaceae bacterium]
MSRVKINAQEILDDLASGKDDTHLMEKYHLSARGLESLFRKLVTAGFVRQSDLDKRMPLRENTVIVDFIPIPSSDLKWKFKADDVVSSPIVSHGAVYFGSWDGNFYAVDVQTGREKWRFTTQGSVHSRPALSDGSICFGSGDSYLYCLQTESGRLNWKFKTGGPVYSSPIILGEVVYFGSGDGHVYAVRFASGIEKWKFRTDAAVHSTPAMGEGIVCFGSDDNYLYALEAAGGGFNVSAWTDDVKRG